MYAYIVRRLLIMPLLLFGVTILLFLMISTLKPEERLALYVRDAPRTEAMANTLIKTYDLDKPIWVQYANWLFGKEGQDPTTGATIYTGGLLRGDLGWSKTASDTIAHVIQRRFPATVELALWSVIPILGVGIWMGVAAAVNRLGQTRITQGQSRGRLLR